MNNFVAVFFGVTTCLLAAEEGKSALAQEPCLILVTEVSVLTGAFPIRIWEAHACTASVPNLCGFAVAHLLTAPPSHLCSQCLLDKKAFTGKLMIITQSVIHVRSRERAISLANK